MSVPGFAGCLGDLVEVREAGSCLVHVHVPGKSGVRPVWAKRGEFELLRLRRNPDQNPGKSKQDYATPWEFIRAIQDRFQVEIAVDLAAVAGNAKAPLFITPEMDSLEVDWREFVPRGKAAYLNPEFGMIKKFSARCAHFSPLGSDFKIFLLTPHTIAGWYRNNIAPHARSQGLVPRLKFEGEQTQYIKDLSLHCYGWNKRGTEIWNWRRPWPT